MKEDNIWNIYGSGKSDSYLIDSAYTEILSDRSESYKNNCPYDLLISKRVNIFEKLYIKAAKDLGISVKEENHYLIFFNDKTNYRLSYACWMDLNSSESVILSNNKNRCTEISKKYFTTPEQILINYQQEENYQNIADNFLEKYSQIVLKPASNTNQALDVLFIMEGINKREILQKNLTYLKSKYPAILLEEYIDATEHRLVMIDNEPVILLEKRPTILIGDGESTIEDLVKKANQEVADKFVSNMGDNFKGRAPSIKMPALMSHLDSRGLSIKKILRKKEMVKLSFSPLIINWLVKDISQIPLKTMRYIKNCNKECGLGLSAFDFFIKNDQLVFLEINPNPAFFRCLSNEPSKKVLEKLFF